MCSLLIGVGFDAYCVYGKAPRAITTKNESLLECLYKGKGKLVEDELAKLREKKPVGSNIANNNLTINENVLLTKKSQSKYYSEFDKKIRDE